MASVHPSLRNIFDVPEVAPPRPRPGLRPQVNGLTRVRRIPGPPAPKSWLSHSKHAPKQDRIAADARRVQLQCIRLPDAYLVDEKSLQHTVLKALALNWNWHAESDHLYLTRIPLRLRETLLSYISVYRVGEENVSNPLKVLFPAPGHVPDLEDETQEVRRLDLTNALGRWLSFKALRSVLVARRNAYHDDDRLKESLLSPLSISSIVDKSISLGTPESWEDETEQQREHAARRQQLANTIDSIQKPHVPRFPNLRHLSLALDPTGPTAAVSWYGLLAIAPHLQTLESLSLAYWPLPTYTPQAAATYAAVSTPTGHIVFGGTNMYSAIDKDWRESAGILKSLSRSLYCLKWLDLTGCTSWLPALVWEENTPLTPVAHDFGPISVPPHVEAELPVSIWNLHWRGVASLILDIGWRPNGKLDHAVVTGASAEYRTVYNTVDDVAKRIRQKRQAGKGLLITIDCGEAIDAQ